MYVFYFISVALHILATIVLLEKLWLTESCFGISGKSRILYTTVFTIRYTELVFNIRCCIPIGDMLLIFSTLLFVLSYITCYSIYRSFRRSYDRDHDTFRIQYLIMFVAVFVLFFDYDHKVGDSVQAFSNYLECVAILPQFFMIIKAGKIEKIMLYYLFILALSSVFSTVHHSINSTPWTDRHGVLFGIEDLIYCGFFVSIWQGKIKIRTKEIQDNKRNKFMKSDYIPNNNLYSFWRNPDKKELKENELTINLYESNIKECTLSLDTNEFKKCEDEITKVAQEISNSKEANMQARANITPLNHIIQGTDHGQTI